MNQYAIINTFRTLLTRTGASEIPAYPDFSVPAWLHPDLVFPGFGTGPQNRFLFQPTQGVSADGKEQQTRVVLAWMQKPFHPDWLASIPNLLEGFFANPPACPLGFHPRGGKFPGHFFQPRGCAWNISWNAMPVGSVLLLSELMDHPITGDVGLCLLEIDRFQFLSSVFSPDPTDQPHHEKITPGFLAWRPKDRRSVFCLKDCSNEHCLAHLQTSVEDFLSRREWLEAFRSLLEGHAFFQSSRSQSTRACFLLSEFEKTFKPHLRKIVVMAREELK
jgi:hypothetical protein